MDVVEQLEKTKKCAHTHLLRTDRADTARRLRDMLLKEASTADIYITSCGALGVDDARAITDFASLKPVGNRKYVIVEAGSMTPQAQNALLKAVEEGVGHSTFFFIVRPGVPVLPTLVSRCTVLKEREQRMESREQGEVFLKMPYAERLKAAEKLAKDSDREGARELVRALLALAASKKFDAAKLRDLLDADQYLALSGSSPKSIIGHLALVL
ncbi:MAG: hypothetical protein ACE5F4_01400 [Candidatus Paceibacteria bacterium]